MAITINIYDQTNNISKTITCDVLGDILAASDTAPTPANASSYTYFIKMNTTARQSDGTTNGTTYEPKIIRSLDELALNGEKRSKVDSAVAYTNIADAIEDYVYDYINGHTAGQYSTNCSAQYAMLFK